MMTPKEFQRQFKRLLMSRVEGMDWEDKLARVYSFDLVGSFVARPLGLAFTGPVAQAVGFDHWLVVVAAVMGGSSLLALLSRDVRRLVRTG